MTWIFKLFGAAIVLASAASLSRRYCEHLTYRVELTQGFSELLLHIRNKITVFLAPPSELIAGFGNESLTRSGFVALCEELGSPKDAYLEIRNGLPLSSETRRILDGYFDAFGAAYKDELIKSTETAAAALEKETALALGELPREKKLSRTVIFAIALGAIILFI